MDFVIGLVIGSITGITVLALVSSTKHESRVFVATDTMPLSEYMNEYYCNGMTTNIENGKVTGFQVKE